MLLEEDLEVGIAGAGALQSHRLEHVQRRELLGPLEGRGVRPRADCQGGQRTGAGGLDHFEPGIPAGDAVRDAGRVVLTAASPDLPIAFCFNCAHVSADKLEAVKTTDGLLVPWCPG